MKVGAPLYRLALRSTLAVETVPAVLVISATCPVAAAPLGRSPAGVVVCSRPSLTQIATGKNSRGFDSFIGAPVLP